jgi:hypothetical protein
MKKIFLLSLILPAVLLLQAYTWIPFCPDTIHANNICFGVGSWQGLICSPGGMYLYEEDIQEWVFYTYGGLPVNGAAWLDGEKILVAMGNGSWSDGIYTFHLQTHQFEVVEWIVTPNFMQVVPVPGSEPGKFTDEYYVGSQFGGLYRSVGGLVWDEIPYFSGKSCKVIDYFENHLVVSEVSNITNIHWSDDYGATWHEAVAGAPILTDIKFNNLGVLYGIFPYYSNSSGLYRSDDFGNTWNVVFWSDMMGAVGFDAVNTIFVGWESPAGGKEGIAIYDPLAPPPGLTFLNNGLASTNINKIIMNPMMSAIAIFCCTDAGVYMSNDYMVGTSEHTGEEPGITLFPNPVSDKTTITISAGSEVKSPVILFILDNEGREVEKIEAGNSSSNKMEFNWNKGDLPAGIYYLVVRTKNKIYTEKFIIL